MPHCNGGIFRNIFGTFDLACCAWNIQIFYLRYTNSQNAVENEPEEHMKKYAQYFFVRPKDLYNNNNSNKSYSSVPDNQILGNDLEKRSLK